MHVANVLPVIRLILMIAAVTLTTDHLAYAAHSSAECYHNGHRIFIPDGLNYPRQAWAGWGISCRIPKPETAAESGASGNDHNDVRTRVRPTSDVIGWRDVTEEPTSADKAAIDKPAADNAANKAETDIDADKAAAR